MTELFIVIRRNTAYFNTLALSSLYAHKDLWSQNLLLFAAYGAPQIPTCSDSLGLWASGFGPLGLRCFATDVLSYDLSEWQ